MYSIRHPVSVIPLHDISEMLSHIFAIFRSHAPADGQGYDASCDGFRIGERRVGPTTIQRHKMQRGVMNACPYISGTQFQQEFVPL
jgi:hypothetical protein